MNRAADKPLIALVAGEASGDILGAGLMRALRNLYPNARFVGVGGALMEQQGLQSLFPMERLSVMGITEVLGRLPELLRLRKQLVQFLLDTRPDVYIGIDSPDFNLPIARKLHARGIRTTHYVSPSVWAWRQGRVKGIKQSIDLMLTLLPFEARFYQEQDVPVTFVGHPLADEIAMTPDTRAARDSLGLSGKARVLALLPGSRGGEVKQLLPCFLDAAASLCDRYPDLKVVVPAANASRYAQIRKLLDDKGMAQVELVSGNSRQVMQAADVVLLASGTATLEAMLLKKPMVVGYRMGAVSHAIISRLLKSPYVSLPNLLAGEELVPELIQGEMTAVALDDAVSQWFENPSKVTMLQQQFASLHAALCQGGSNKAAAAVAQLLES